jgi:ubiquinone biosynthesis protein Coq4
LVESNGENEFKNYMNTSLDGWPLIDNKFNQSQTVLDRLVKYQKAGMGFLFTLKIQQNIIQPNSQVITVKNFFDKFIGVCYIFL